MTECPECYSNKKRATPLQNPRDCLENHLQYICGTCGRCICINKTGKNGLQRWNFPFQSAETAKLYLRTADATEKTNCGIYENPTSNGRKSFKIFRDEFTLKEYLEKNRGKSCTAMRPVYKRPEYREFPIQKSEGSRQPKLKHISKNSQRAFRSPGRHKPSAAPLPACTDILPPARQTYG